MQVLQGYITAEDPDTGELKTLCLGATSPSKAQGFADYLNRHPVNMWSGDTPAIISVARDPHRLLAYLEQNFQAPRTRGARFVDLAGPEWSGPSPKPF